MRGSLQSPTRVHRGLSPVPCRLVNLSLAPARVVSKLWQMPYMMKENAALSHSRTPFLNLDRGTSFAEPEISEFVYGFYSGIFSVSFKARDSGRRVFRVLIVVLDEVA